MRQKQNQKNNKEIKQIIDYIIFGIITTIFNISIYEMFKFIPTLKENLTINNLITTILTVIFAFIVNKLFVFNKEKQDKDKDKQDKDKQDKDKKEKKTEEKIKEEKIKEEKIKEETKKEIEEFIKFIAFRILVYLVIELMLFTFMIKVLYISDDIVKIITQGLVMYAIYVFSKMYIFK